MDFQPGDYVLVYFPPASKLVMKWQGPYIVICREDPPVLYTVADLQDHIEQKIHVDRMHIFWPGNLSDKDLLAESARHNEFYIETVYKHVIEDKVLYFRIKKLGFPDYLPIDERAWCPYKDYRYAPAIKAYVAAKKIVPSKIRG